MILICFPWAAGSSAIYASWHTHPALKAVFSSIVCVDYPGRASRSDETSIEHIAPLVQSILNQYKCFDQSHEEPIVLFGHSFGAIVAFEVARHLEERGMQPVAVFVSASVPPSKTPLVETAVSKLSTDEICDYFASKGNPVSEVLRSTPEFLELFIRNVRVDYTCLETYPTSDSKLKAPLVVVGGGLDPGVSTEDLKNWNKHVHVFADGSSNQGETKDEHERSNSTVLGQVLTTKVYPNQGHFYLNDEGIKSDLAAFISETVSSLGTKNLAKADFEEEAAETLEHVRGAFAKALGTLSGEISPDAHFFNELGGSSLDTMILTAHLQGTVGLRVTQDEIILHPTLNSLAERIMELKKLSSNAPTLDPVESVDGHWYPASAGQEQMVALFETSPTMYNMPTTIEFHGHVDTELLQKAMEHVTKQQEGLRTVVKFDMEKQKVLQKVLHVNQATQCFAFVQIQASDDDAARSIIERESGFVFDLDKPPVFRAVLVKTPVNSLLLLNQHHVGADGWSRTQYRSQILKAYLALTRGEEPEVIPRHPTYVAWTMYTRRLLFDHGQKEKQLAYWKDKLADLPVLDLPLDHARPMVLSSRGARIPVAISAELTSKFSLLMAKAKSNLFVGLLSLYMSLLNAWGGGEKFSIGVAMANRQHEGLDKLVGYMANEVAIVGDFSKDPNFIDILSQIRKNVLEAMGNADVPFHEVCEELNVERSSSRTSVFQAMFALQEAEWHSLDEISPKRGEGEVSFNLKQYNHNTSKFEVHLQLRHDGKGALEGDFHVATDLFSVETGERMVEAFIKLMQACIDEPELSVTQHNITPQKDRDIIDQANNTSILFNEISLWDRLESISGDNTAFKIHGDEINEVSYSELREKVKKVGQFVANLRDASIETQCMGILVRNSAEGVMMILGTYLAGMTSVILDIDKTPINRIDMIFKDANVRTVLVMEKEDVVVGSLSDDFTVFTWVEMLNEEQSEQNLICPRNEDHPFSIFYTSGTTGLPKGVVIQLRNVTNLWNWWVDYFSLCREDRCMLFSSLSFIMSLRQWLPPLLVGASVTIPRNTLEFESAIVDCKVNKLVCTPSALAALDIDMVGKQIQEIQVAGEPPQKKTLELWSNRVEKLHIGLGPTELCAHALCGQFDGDKISIGLPAANVRAYVVNKHGDQVPINCVGELWIAGANVAKGYLNRDAENKKHFSKDAFVGDGCGLYKTGDLCKRLADGRIQFIGRRDKQIKLNGYRIEIGDIQNAMGGTVKNSLVMIHNGQLVAFVMPKVETNDVKRALEDKLPTYMVPSRILSVETFPLNKNRKIDTDSLVKLIQNDTTHSADNESNAIETHVEKVMKMVWSEVLGVNLADLSRSDNFFSRGGTSLTAVIMARKLSKELCTDVSVQDVFRYQTIAAFAEHLESVSDIFDGIPAPLLFLDGGRNVINPKIFAVLQILGLIVMTIVVAVPLIATTFVSVRSIIWFGFPGIMLFPPFVMAGCIAHMLLVLLCKWGMMGRFREGKAKVFSWYFLKWWLVRRVIHVSSLYSWVFDETPLSSVWLRLLGAKIGSGTSLEQPYVLEPDLVTIGNDCVIEFEAQLSTSEIKGGVIEFRRVKIGDNVKLGVRSVLLGGTNVESGCEVLPKAALDWTTSPKANKLIGGSPAKIVGETSGKAWRLKTSKAFLCCQLIGVLLVLLLMAAVAFVGMSIGIVLSDKYGSIALIAYLGALFPTMSSVIFLLLVAALYRVILPNLQPEEVYSDSFFLWRKWLMDRLFLSPMFRYASERTLQTSSTFPWYLKLLGAKTGAKAWMNHPYIRVGVNFLDIGSAVHMGMHSYMTTARVDGSGVSFHPILIENEVSFGQRCVILSGSWIGRNSTVGAETMIPHDFILESGETTFGRGSLTFSSSLSHADRVRQTQASSRTLAASAKSGRQVTTLESVVGHEDEEMSENNDRKISRRQDIGNEMFWTYVFVMLFLQAMIPLAIGASYAVLYWAATKAIPNLSFQIIILISPVLYIMGSFILMIVLKLLQSLGGGFAVGTSNFFSFKFLYWHLLADMIYFCTSTVLYPMSGTFIYCAWLRFMGARIGKSVFISPENGGFREIDFMNIGDNCVLMTPNIHAHYTDHGQLQFCSIILEDNVVINFGATVMPLTQYQEGCCLRPHSVTVKGQLCETGQEYFGNPCKAGVASASLEYAAILFPGQGSQYHNMMDKLKHLPYVQELLSTAEDVFGWNLLEEEDIFNTKYSQPLMFVAGLAHAEWMKQKLPTMFTRVKAVAGFSLGEITALCFSGAITLVDAMRLVKLRAEAMADCNGGAMCNVRGLSFRETKLLCRKLGCTIANIICNHEEEEKFQYNIFVCAGTAKEIASLVNAVKSKGGKAKQLRVSGAFHSKHMTAAQRGLSKVIDSINVTLPEDILIYSNVTGRPYKSTKEIKHNLKRHITSPVLWHSTVQSLVKEEGVTTFVECGPMSVLTATVKAILKDGSDSDEERQQNSIKIFHSDELESDSPFPYERRKSDNFN